MRRNDTHRAAFESRCPVTELPGHPRHHQRWHHQAGQTRTTSTPPASPRDVLRHNTIRTNNNETRCSTTGLKTHHHGAPAPHHHTQHEKCCAPTEFTTTTAKSVAPQHNSPHRTQPATRAHQAAQSPGHRCPTRNPLSRNTIHHTSTEKHWGTTGFITPQSTPRTHHQASDIRDTPNTLRPNTIRTPPNVIRCDTTGFTTQTAHQHTAHQAAHVTVMT